jgi:Flp pilus assembly protein TadB
LSTHHGHQVGENRAINNSCPSCGFFERDRKKWKSWDGTIHNPQKVKQRNTAEDHMRLTSLYAALICAGLFLAYTSFWKFVSTFAIGYLVYYVAYGTQQRAKQNAEAAAAAKRR